MSNDWLRPDWVLFRKALVVLALILVLVMGAYSAQTAGVLAQEDAGAAGIATTVTHVLPYQGRLLDPATGQPKPDGDYPIAFRLYTVATAGTAIWTESKTVSVASGLFHTFLGDVTPLNLSNFNGQNLWVGVTVGSEAEATPRLRLGFGAYAFYAENAANASTVGGQAPAAFASAGHNHDDLYYTKSQADSQYLSSTVPALIQGSNNAPALQVSNAGAGHGIRGDTSSTDNMRAGVYGGAGSSGVTLTSNYGAIGESSSGIGVGAVSQNGYALYAHSVNSVGLVAYSQNNLAIAALGNMSVAGTINGVKPPIANGFILAAGAKSVGSDNVSSLWNASLNRYEITITGESYQFASYVTTVTTTCPAYTARTDSISGRLIVQLYNAADNPAQCEFQFVTYKP